MIQPKRILIVDDDKEISQSVKLALEETGRYFVIPETRGAKVYDLVQAYQPDCILLDILIPDVAGSIIAQRLKEDPETSHIPIIFFSAIVSKEELKSAGGLISGRPFIAKPPTMTEVIETIEKTLRNGQPTAKAKPAEGVI